MITTLSNFRPDIIKILTRGYCVGVCKWGHVNTYSRRQAILTLVSLARVYLTGLHHPNIQPYHFNLFTAPHLSLSSSAGFVYCFVFGFSDMAHFFILIRHPVIFCAYNIQDMLFFWCNRSLFTDMKAVLVIQSDDIRVYAILALYKDL